ncbi:MAG: serine--tRNA ligase [Gemmatimonadales bacterium]|nr:serine--tRNA ligase [Gemmatimonadales bacterium]
MIDVKRLRQDPEGSRAALARRLDPRVDAAVARILELDRRRRDVLVRTEALKAQRNAQSDEVARGKKAGDDVAELMAALKASGEQVKGFDAQVREVDAALETELLGVPNFLRPDVPEGDASANVELRRVGTPRALDFAPRPHWDLGANLGILDLAAGALVTGSGFPVFRGAGARLVRGLASFMLDMHVERHGYTEVSVPYVVNRASMQGTGQLPKFADELYTVTADELFLIPTAEVPVTNLHRDAVLDGASLPFGYACWTPCFRREAGAAGKDTRGLIRVHQFDKVELVRFCRPEESEAQHALITSHAEAVLRALEIPYRVLALAAGDTGFASARTHDLEAWAPGVGGWLEVSSASTFTDYQARRANIRFRPSAGAKPEFVHTLNASGLAFPRTLIALLENHQEADGSVRIPGPLVPYVGIDRLVARGG